jgi:hypothetical protein
MGIRVGKQSQFKPDQSRFEATVGLKRGGPDKAKEAKQSQFPGRWAAVDSPIRDEVRTAGGGAAHSALASGSSWDESAWRRSTGFLVISVISVVA